jgi:hypothetical protein
MKMNKRKYFDLIIFFKLLCLMALLGLSGCKKKSTQPQPIAITVDADIFEIGMSPDNVKTKGLGVIFHYNNVQYDLTANRVDRGNENGSAVIADTNMISSTSTLAESQTLSDVIFVTNPTMPNTITFSIDQFDNDLREIQLFNKITVNITSNTQFAVDGYELNPGDTNWADQYSADLPGFTNLIKNVAMYINDADLSTAGNQRMPVRVFVQ